MRDYSRRMLLIPPTLLGISILVFAITAWAIRAFGAGNDANATGLTDFGGGSALGSDQALSEEQLEQMKDSMVLINHIGKLINLLGVLPRETEFRQIRFLQNERN